MDLPARLGKSGQILCIGAHCDDIEIGCGGTILRLLREYPRAEVTWVVLTSSVSRASEARRAASRFLEKARRHRVSIEKFRDGFLPTHAGRVKEYFEALKGRIDPDVIFTPYRNDLHQDHRLASELTWNTFRNHLILEYEIPKYDGDLGVPNAFSPLSEKDCQTKIRLLLETYASQRDRDWFTEDTFRALLRLRGIECRSPWAEAFHCRKVLL
jgi:LmbE family N-acetylglucosaminyl deacetylase